MFCRFLPAAWCNLQLNFKIIHPKDKPMKLQRSWLKSSKTVDKSRFASYRQVSNKLDVQGSHINILNKVEANLQFEHIMYWTCPCYPLHFSAIFLMKTSHPNNHTSVPGRLHLRLMGRNKIMHNRFGMGFKKSTRRMSRFSLSTLLNPQISHAQMISDQYASQQ